MTTHDPRAVLDVIRQRADNATDGPWAAWEDLDRTPGNRGLLTVGIADEVIPDGEVFVETREADGPSPVAECYVHEDREFIAAARSDVPRLVAALTAALDLHVKTDGLGIDLCTECRTVLWPCPTVRAITDALTEEES